VSSRRTELLEAAAKALDSGEDPLALHFLSGHDVTSDECLALAGQLALGARVVAKALDDVRSILGREVLLVLASSPD
jgi:hypothetical protein